MSDLISRQDAIKAIDDLQNCYNGYSDTYDKAYIIGVLEDVPSVDVPDRKVGKWIDAWRSALDGTRHWYRECSECGYERDDDNIDKDTKFCPNCGAYMGVEDEPFS